MDTTQERTAQPVVVGYTVPCIQCHEPIVAPETLLARTMWMPDELARHRRAYCPACDVGFPIAPVEEGYR